MKKLFLVLTVLVLFIPVNGQNQCRLTGFVLDSIGYPVHDANLTAFDSSNIATTYTFSDVEGSFSLDLPCDQDFEVEITHINYKDELLLIHSKKHLKKTIVLKENAISLNEIVAQGKRPITIKGDTIEYDADSFMTGEEEVLEDLLKKLPGLRVEDGKIYYQDKEINSVKIEGREVFGGSAKILTKNLPANAVSKVQLNKRFKSNPFANSLQSDEQPELNIVLKDDKKSLAFGNLLLGGDAIEHYDIQSKVFRFSPKTDLTLIGDFNSIGKQVFGPEDYYNFLGGSDFLFDSKGQFNLIENPSNFNFWTSTNASELKNHLVASHLGYVLPKDWEIKAFAVASDERLNFNSINNRYFNSYTQTDDALNENKSKGILSRFEVKGYPTKKLIFNYNLLQNYQEQENLNDLRIKTSFLDASVQQNSAQDLLNFGLSQNLRLIQSLSKEDNIGLYVTHNYNRNADKYILTSENGQNSLLGIPTNQVEEKYKFKSNDIKIHSVYNHLLSSTTNLEVVGGYNITHQSLNNKWVDDTFSSVQNVEESFNYNQTHLTTTYTKQWEKLLMKTGIELHYFNYNTDTFLKRNKFKVLPTVKFNYKFSSSKFLELNYSADVAIPNLTSLTNSQRIEDYYLIGLGNNQLKEGLYHSINFIVGNFNFRKFFNFYLNINYSLLEDNIRQASTFNNGLQVIYPININSPESSLSARVQFGKKFSKWYKIGIKNFGSYNTFNNVINESATDVTQFTNSFNLNNNFKIKKKLETDLNFTWNYNLYKNEQIKNNFHSFNPSIKTAYIINDKLIAEFYLAHTIPLRNSEVLEEYIDLNAKLRYNIMKGVYFYINANNLLNNSEIITNGFTDNYSYTNVKDVLGRYILAELKFKF